MFTSQFLHGCLVQLVDPECLLRANLSTLTQQTLMELLVADLEIRHRFKDDEEEFRPISTWRDVSAQDEIVTNIYWYQLFCTGTMDMQFLPPTLITFTVEQCGPSGSLNLSNLPPQMTIFRVTRNNFSGSVDLCHLPENLEDLALNYNSLSGSLDLTQLPQSLITANFDANQFSGSICLAHLPSEMCELYADNNKISGTIRLNTLQERMYEITLEKNHITGTIDVGALPASFGTLVLSENKITCVKGIEHLNKGFSLYLQDNAIVQDAVPANDKVHIVSLSGKTIGKVVDTNGVAVSCEKIRLS